MENSSEESPIKPMPTEPTSWQSEISQRELAEKYPDFQRILNLRKSGKIFLISSPLIALSPILLSLILIPLTCGGFSGANEGNCGAAALPWFMFFSIPASILIAIGGAVVMSIASARKATFIREHR